MKLTYRPEIDGLRAIAVVAVILYHAQITIFGHQAFKGGFIGVDIFFVISGYLISSLIFKEIKETNNFSFTNFYTLKFTVLNFMVRSGGFEPPTLGLENRCSIQLS